MTNETTELPHEVIAKALNPWQPPDEIDQLKARDIISALRDAGYFIVKDASHE